MMMGRALLSIGRHQNVFKLYPYPFEAPAYTVQEILHVLLRPLWIRALFLPIGAGQKEIPGDKIRVDLPGELSPRHLLVVFFHRLRCAAFPVSPWDVSAVPGGIALVYFYSDSSFAGLLQVHRSSSLFRKCP